MSLAHLHPHPACVPDDDLLRQCTVTTGRAGGPGGQHRNKVETLVRIVHRPTSIEAHAGERRSQSENKHVAIRRLRLYLAARHRVPPPVPPRVAGRDVSAVLDALDSPGGSDLWKSRCRSGRIACNPNHHDYPALLAEALDHISDAGWDEKSAARRLSVTPSQLVKLVKDCPEAMVAWNAARGERGLHMLH